MIIHPEFIFLHLPKTGGTFIENFLVKNIYNCEYLGKALKEDLINFRNKKIKNKRLTCRHDSIYRYDFNSNILKFGYIRNPYDWYLSFWAFSRNRHQVYNKLHLNNETKEDLNIFVKSLFKYGFILDYYTGSLLDVCHKNKLTHINTYITSSLDIGLLTYKYLYTYYHPFAFNDFNNYQNYKIIDYILRFENLTSELDKFFSSNLFELNENQKNNLYNGKKIRASNHGYYSEYYDKETIDLIRHKDRLIFKEFGYEF